jgi:hypothetical protein
MRPSTATLIVSLIEGMIIATVAAALTGKIKDPEYERAMQDRKTKIAEILETIETHGKDIQL